MFKSTHVFIGTIEKGQQACTAKWDFAEGFGKENVDRVQPGCSCTAAVLYENSVIASFNEVELNNWTEQDITQNRIFYPAGFVMNKEITVFPKDGVPIDIDRGDGGTYPNPEKNRIVLTFSAFVKF